MEEKNGNEIRKRYFHIRIEEDRKTKWQTLCEKRKISLTSLIINSVENRLMMDEKNEITAFIEKQDNIFAKIENNINQIARYVNTQHFVDQTDVRIFNAKLAEISNLKLRQNELMNRIYRMLLETKKKAE